MVGGKKYKNEFFEGFFVRINYSFPMRDHKFLSPTPQVEFFIQIQKKNIKCTFANNKILPCAYCSTSNKLKIITKHIIGKILKNKNNYWQMHYQLKFLNNEVGYLYLQHKASLTTSDCCKAYIGCFRTSRNILPSVY